MSEANQVRINELARELEVKAKAIIDLLPGYGVTEKKTHSSSIPEDVAEKVRKNILGQAEAEAAAEASAKADKEAKEAAAKAARMRPASAPAPVAATPSVVAKPAAPSVV
ncbi:MAG: translation initiation factor IF-2 N-terminal domain-containing protein, partial [Candidatus Acidiferrum sp.]